ncbi:MAG: hypothetical protein AB8G17_06335 [Gammaproteobacteria bacterium]
MTASSKTVRIDTRFRGPPDSANGGYTAGLLAGTIDGPSEVTLRAPPPLDTNLTLAGDNQTATLTDGDVLIATARAAPLDLSPPPPVDYATALGVREQYAGFTAHNFPGCFVCGPERADTDGMRVFAAPHADQVVAAWQAPGGPFDPLLIHAALDCPSYFALRDSSLVALLGRMHGEVFAHPQPQETCVVVGWALGREGRKSYSGAALYGADSRLLAMARNTWIELKP